MPDSGLLMLVLLVVYAIVWTATLISLMRREDKTFVGRYDKLIWAGVLILVPVLGLIAYGVVASDPRPHKSIISRKRFTEAE